MSKRSIEEVAYVEKMMREARLAERERCALKAERFKSWGNLATRQSGLAEHIAKVIRNQTNHAYPVATHKPRNLLGVDNG